MESALVIEWFSLRSWRGSYRLLAYWGRGVANPRLEWGRHLWNKFLAANGGFVTKTSLGRTNNSARYAGYEALLHDQFHQIWIILWGNSLLRYLANKVHTFRPYTCPIWHRSKNDVLNSSPLIFPLLTAKQTQKLKCNNEFFCRIFYVPATPTPKA